MSGWEGIFAVEKSPMAFGTLEHNLVGKGDAYSFRWPKWLPTQAMDVQSVLEKYSEKLAELSGLDLLAGGPPCQGFSMAGRRKIDDERNYLVDYYLSFVELTKPKLILIENVRTFATPFSRSERGVNGHKIENSFNADQDLQDRLSGLGYKPFAKYPLMAKNYGVPQLRPRYILIAVKKELIEEYPNIDPFNTLESLRTKFLTRHGLPSEEEITLMQAISDLEKSHGEEKCAEEGMDNFKQGKYGPIDGPYQRLMRKHRNGKIIKDGQVADSHRFPNHKPETILRFQEIISDFRPGVQLSPIEIETFGLRKHRIAPLAAGEACHTLTSLPDDLIHYREPRIPTVREYARIQSFPDWFQFKSKYTTGGDRRKIEVPRYTQAANAVPPLLAEALGRTLLLIHSKLNRPQKESITNHVRNVISSPVQVAFSDIASSS